MKKVESKWVVRMEERIKGRLRRSAEKLRKATQAANTVSDKGDTHNGRLGGLEREFSFVQRVHPRPSLDEARDRTGACRLHVRESSNVCNVTGHVDLISLLYDGGLNE